MNRARKLRVVPDCPQAYSRPVKPGSIVYGAAPWSRLPHNPPANEITIRSRAQSLISKGGKLANLPSYEDAVRIIAEYGG